jgi:hypothetical protein
MQIKSVAVIGGGPAGLIALDCLIREHQFSRIRLFERQHEAGGAWVSSMDPPEDLPPLRELNDRTASSVDCVPSVELPAYVPKSNKQRFMDTAIYPYLETNVEDKIMEFTEEPFPEDKTPTSIEKFGENTPYRHHLRVKHWIQGLYKNKGYDDHLVFNTSVELCTKLPNGQWEIVLRTFGKRQDYVWKEYFDAIVVAAGKYVVPFIPIVPGLQEFNDRCHGSVIHSKAYRSREYYRDKSVVVVGASISAMDLLHDILPVAKGKVISSKKHDTMLLPVYGSAPFEHPKVDNRGKIVKVDAGTKTVYFDDNTCAKVDCIIYGTGYSFNFPFLPNVNLKNNRIHGLYQNVSYIDDPSLAFVGCVAGGMTFKVFEWQSVLAARILSGRAKLPPKEEQLEWERQRVLRKGDSEKFVFILGE